MTPPPPSEGPNEGKDARTVAVLFARADSIYKTMPGCDVWDIERDAMKWPGGCPVVAHPPCGPWGNMSQFCTLPLSDKQLAVWSVRQIRQNGGILEHPEKSRLFAKGSLPDSLPPQGERDKWGGYVIWIQQWWFGHRAQKGTKLYICGCEPKDLPPIPIKLGDAPAYVRYPKKVWTERYTVPITRPEITKAEREHTPPLLAEWLVATARLCDPLTSRHP